MSSIRACRRHYQPSETSKGQLLSACRIASRVTAELLSAVLVPKALLIMESSTLIPDVASWRSELHACGMAASDSPLRLAHHHLNATEA